MNQVRTVSTLSKSFDLLTALYNNCDEADELRLTKVAIEMDSLRALKVRVGSNPALAIQLEIKLLALDNLITKNVVDRLAYYAMPTIQSGENEKGILTPELASIVKKHYEMAEMLDEDFQLRSELSKILALVDESQID